MYHSPEYERSNLDWEAQADSSLSFLNSLYSSAGIAADVEGICAAVKKRQDEIGNLTDTYMNILRQKHVST